MLHVNQLVSKLAVSSWFSFFQRNAIKIILYMTSEKQKAPSFNLQIAALIPS